MVTVALPPLATVADLTARGITVEPGEEGQVATWLDVASAVLRDAAGSPISQVTSTVKLTAGRDRRLRLPGPPVTEIATVLVDGDLLDPSLYRLVHDDLVRLPAWCCWWDWRLFAFPPEITVTYTHGLPIVPADIVDLTCSLVAAALVASRDEPDGEGLAASPGVVQESIDDYSVSFNRAQAGLTVFELSDMLRRRLAARFGGGVAMLSAS